MSSAQLDDPCYEGVQWPLTGELQYQCSNNTDWMFTLDNCTIPIGCFMRHSQWWTITYCLAYSIVFVVGVVGNSCVLGVITRNGNMRTTFHVLLANLAVADLMVTIFCLPVTLVGHVFGAWILGLFVCKSVAYLQGVSVSASINTLVAISVDRFLAICYPMKCHFTSRGCRLIILSIWTFSFTITLPWTLYFQLTPMYRDGDPRLQVCREVWPNERMGVIYFVVANLILCYLLPLSIITVCYVFIWVKVWKRQMIGESQDRDVEQMMHRSKIKVVKMLLVIIIVFALSWLPLYIIFARIKIGDQYEEGSIEDLIIQIVAPVAQWLGASNSCINPVLYAFFNNKFRRGFKAILFNRRCCSNDILHNTAENTYKMTFVGNKKIIETRTASKKTTTNVL